MGIKGYYGLLMNYLQQYSENTVSGYQSTSGGAHKYLHVAIAPKGLGTGSKN